MRSRHTNRMVPSSYESFFGLAERPFSLTPDPKYFFKSRSHGRAMETIAFALRRREPFVTVNGDFGLGKTTLCVTLTEQLRRRMPVALVTRPLVGGAEFLRLVLRELVRSSGNAAHAAFLERADVVPAILELLAQTSPTDGAVVIVDEAHLMPSVVAEQISTLLSIATDERRPLQFVLAAQSAPPADPATRPHLPVSLTSSDGRGIARFEEQAPTRLRLLALVRADCTDYISHRLAVAGTGSVTFSPRALDVVFQLSGGVPRLVNLLCERALQEAAAATSLRVEPGMVEGAAAALELARARPKRFRWFGRYTPPYAGARVP